jgi:hypothetical protein
VRARKRLAGMCVVTALSLPACSSDEPGPREGVRVEDLTGDASGAFDVDDLEAGQSVSLRVEVGEVLSPDSFVVPSEQTAGDPLLVLVRGHDLAPGDVVQVAGIARVFSYDEQAGDHELAADAAYADFDGRLALVAQLEDENLPLDDQ